MKNILVVFVMCIPWLVFAQATEYGNFKLVEQEIIYQKVYVQDSITVASLADYFKTIPGISNMEVTGDELRADLTDMPVDYKKFQYSQMNTPSIIQTGKYSGKIRIEAKENRYRVTVSALQLTGDIGYKKITVKDNLTNYAARNSGTQLSPDWCKPNMLGLLDKAITDKLLYRKPEKKKDNGDW